MKNIHILPTDKPTGIFKSGDNLLFSIMNKVRTTHEGFHIYITNDEQAKEGDWGYIPFQGGDVKLVGKYFADDWKKIILTTDQSLDGVQKIADDFLEWFIKNPSCEEVEIRKEMYIPQSNGKISDGKITHEISLDPSQNTLPYYKIIIPKQEQCTCKEHDPYCCQIHGSCPTCVKKEEQKRHLINIMRGDEELGLYEEPKQETLEEVAREFYSDENQLMERIAFKRGYTECEERMYSEEDMIEFNEWVSLNFPNQHNYLRALQKHNQGLYVPKEKLVGYYSTKELFEQFKKK